MQSETLSAIVLFAGFLILTFHGVPIAFSIAISTTLAYFFILPPELAFAQVARDMFHGIDSYALLAIPMFILAGFLMGEGGVAARLIAFSEVLFGRIRGGLSLANVMTCMLFGAISGSAAAASSSIGSTMIPEMERKGYGREFSTALTVSASTLGLLIPPSNVMIIYAVAWGSAEGFSVDIAEMFIAGIGPGIFLGIGLMIVSYLMARRAGIQLPGRVAASEGVRRGLKALPGLMLLVIVLGGILSGFFTATEASAVAVLYSAIISLFVYRSVSAGKLAEILRNTAITTGYILFLVAASKAMGNLMVRLEIPETATQFLTTVSSNPVVILLMINVILLLAGTFMDITPAILIFTPMLSAIAVQKLGMNPIHFGLILIANLSIGLCTPPVGTVLFVGCGVGKVSIGNLIRPLLPFYFTMIAALLVLTYAPESVVMWLPRTLTRLLGG